MQGINTVLHKLLISQIACYHKQKSSDRASLYNVGETRTISASVHAMLSSVSK